uniref:Uncharacterized protein n=1 Tax=Arundo donax TaxID=35708 RepID=A0A0A8Z6X6_ARUDO
MDALLSTFCCGMIREGARGV